MYKRILGCFLVVMFFTSCNKTPSTTIIYNESNQIKPLETMGSGYIDNLPIINIKNEEINEIFELEMATVTLNGVVSKPDTYKDIYIYTSEVINYNDYESNMTFLFGQNEEKMFRDKVTGHLVVRLFEDEQEFNAEIFNSSLSKESDFTGQWGAIRFLKGERPIQEELRRVNLTYEDAKQQADELINKIGVGSFEYDCCVYNEEVLQITPEGTISSPLGDTLSVYYVQKIQGIPVRTTIINNRTTPGLNVDFDSEGVCEVRISEYEYKQYSAIEQCVEYEEALEIFLEYVGIDASNDGCTFDEVRFQYTITKEYIDGKYVYLAIPYWFFNKVTMHVDQDIYINCLDGSVTEG